MVREKVACCILLGVSAIASPASADREASESPNKYGVRLLATSTELTANITNSRLGTGFGVGVDYQMSRFFNISLELDKVRFENGREDRRARIRERFTFLERGRISGYGMLSAGLTQTQIPGLHGGTGLRIDGETGAGLELNVSDNISLFGEMGLGLGEWIKEPPSALPVELKSTAEGFGEFRAGLKVSF